MCYPTTCTQCGKTTWSGCGQHVADVRRDVADAQWCDGHADVPPSRRRLTRLFGR